MGKDDPAAAVSYDGFASLLHERFSVATPTGEVLLELESVQRLPAAATMTPGYTLIFRGPAAQPLEQGMFSFAHARFGTTLIFIVPTSLDAAGYRYAATFN
jgi:hypothetical protein